MCVTIASDVFVVGVYHHGW